MTQPFILRLLISVASVLGAFFASHTSHAQTAAPLGSGEAVELDKLVVSEKRDANTDSVAVATAALSQVPGSVHVVSGESLERRRAFTTADALAYQPAVFATASGGNDGIKVSVRGSGIANNIIYRSGIDFLFDGLSMPGFAQGTPVANFEPLGLSHTEILVGSNAFDYQSLALGGAINYVSKTGYDASPFQARLDVGSYGYLKAQVSSGRVIGPLDYYVSITSSRSDGFQDWSASESFRVLANFGYKLSDTVTTRLYLRYADVFFELPGNLTRAQIADDPSQGNAVNTASGRTIDPDHNIWVGNKTTIEIDGDSRLETGVAFNTTPQYNANSGVAGGYVGQFRDDNLTASIRYERSSELFGRQSESSLGLRANYVLKSYARTDDWSLITSPTYGQQIRRTEQDGTNNIVLSASNDLEVAKNLWLRTGVSGIRTEISNRIVIGPGVIDNTNSEYSEYDYNYVLGLRYDIRPDVQVFANVSRSVEPVAAANTRTNTFNRLNKVENQTGTTYEIGTRAKAGIFEGSLSLYRTELRNELLTVATQLVPTLVTQTVNASPTVHQGIELGLSTTLWEDAGASAGQAPHRVVFRQTYTLNDFYYEDDATWGGNELPGVPRHYYQAELTYDHPSGFYAGVNAKYASDYFVDYANTLSARSYVLYGASLGYAPPGKGWEVHLEAINLGDKHYATSARTTYNAGGVDSALFLPGDGFGVYGGFSFHF